jgi:hypothetical protein
MTTIFDSARPVKTARPFGILPPRERRKPYTWQDVLEAAQIFGDMEPDRQLEERYEQARYDEQFNGSYPAGRCLLCGDRCDDPTFRGICDRCDDAATIASIDRTNEAEMERYRVV